MVDHGHGQRLLHPLLADDVVVEVGDQLARAGKLGVQRVPLLVLAEDPLARLDAARADMGLLACFNPPCTRALPSTIGPTLGGGLSAEVAEGRRGSLLSRIIVAIASAAHSGRSLPGDPAWPGPARDSRETVGPTFIGQKSRVHDPGPTEVGPSGPGQRFVLERQSVAPVHTFRRRCRTPRASRSGSSPSKRNAFSPRAARARRSGGDRR